MLAPVESTSPYISQIQPESPPTGAFTDSADERAAWQNIIDNTLIEWGRNPGAVADEGVEPPNRETVGRAIKLAQAFMSMECPAPNSVTVDASGGIVLEGRSQRGSEVLHVWDDGTSEYLRFEGSRLVERMAIPF